MFFISLIFYILSQCNSKNVVLEFNNWTTCDEFLNNSNFDINSIVDIDWKIFFFWNNVEDKSYNMRFSLATPLLVDRFKVALKEIDSSINLTDAVLFMETSIDYSALYLKTETPGKFLLIPSFAFQVETIPLLLFGLKLVPPGYLGIMNCKYKYCYALAPVDKMPEDTNITLSAENINFRGDKNYSYLMQYDIQHVVAFNEDDQEEDEQLELANEVLNLDND